MKQPQVLFPTTTGVVTLCLLLLSSKFVTTAGQVCDDFIAAAAPLLNNDCGTTQPSCSCDTSDEGYFYAICTDSDRLCSSYDSSLCGTQGSLYQNDGDGPVEIYFFTYDDGVTVMLSWMTVLGESVCMANIKDAAGSKWDCQCVYHVCSDGSTMMPHVDCSAYQSGAYADGCMDNWGVQGGVMQALSINSGQCVSGGSTASTPVSAPVSTPGSGSTPTINSGTQTSGGGGGTQTSDGSGGTQTSNSSTTVTVNGGGGGTPPSNSAGTLDLGGSLTKGGNSAANTPVVNVWSPVFIGSLAFHIVILCAAVLP